MTPTTAGEHGVSVDGNVSVWAIHINAVVWPGRRALSVVLYLDVMNINYIHVCTDAGKEAAVSARQRASYRNVFAAVHVGRIIDDKRPSVTGAALGVEGIKLTAQTEPG